MPKSWVDTVAARMRHSMRLRESLGDMTSPPDEIYRQVGMQRREFQQKIATLKRVEASMEREFAMRIGRWHEQREK